MADLRKMIQKQLETRKEERKENALAKAEKSLASLQETARRETKERQQAAETETLESFLMSHSDMSYEQTSLSRDDVKRAEEWAHGQFPGGDNDGILDSPKFLCTFFGTRMTAQPRAYGLVSPFAFHFQLFRVESQLLWVGHNPLTGQVIKHEIQ